MKKYFIIDQSAPKLASQNEDEIFRVEDGLANSLKLVFQNKVELELDLVLGEGGEGLVVQETHKFGGKSVECAVKYALYKANKRYGKIYGPDFIRHLLESNEFRYGTVKHHHVIQFQDFSISKLGDEYFQISGEFWIPKSLFVN